MLCSGILLNLAFRICLLPTHLFVRDGVPGILSLKASDSISGERVRLSSSSL